MTAQQLKASILQLAIQGKLVPQIPEDEPASELLKHIKAEKDALVKAGKIKKDKYESVIVRDADGRYLEKKDGKTTDISDEIPFDVPMSWTWCRINTVAFVTKLAGFEYTNCIASNLTKTGVPLFKGKNIQGDRLVYEFESFIPRELSDQLPRSQITKKCILLPYVGTIGNIAVHKKEGVFHLGSNVGKIELTCNEMVDLLLEEYVVIYLRSAYGFKGLIKEKKATAQESISIQAIRDIYIPIPPFNEQVRIVAKIEELLTHIEEYRKAETALSTLNAELPEQLKKSILQWAIQGRLVPQDPNDEPASELLKRIKSEKASLIKSGKLKKEKPLPPISEDEIPFDIPDSWEWCRIGQVFNLQAGKNISSGSIKEEFVAGYYPCYGGNGLRGYVSNYNHKGDYVLIGRQGALCGNINYATGYFYATEHAVAVDVFAGCDTKWCGLFLTALNLNQYSTATAQPGLAVSKINNILIPLPPLAEQKRIAAKIQSLIQICNSLI